MNKCCEAGVTYSEVRAGPMMFPCLQTGGECSKAQFPTPEQAEAKEKEMLEQSAAALNIMERVMNHVKETKQQTGKIQCDCGAQLAFVVAPNGHIHAGCSSCKISFGQ